jgi:hypothetical protein
MILQLTMILLSISSTSYTLTSSPTDVSQKDGCDLRYAVSLVM